jgi:hypothetical protein
VCVNRKTIPEQDAIIEVRRIQNWVWPHYNVVYPVRKMVPIVETASQKKGRRLLAHIETYLSARVASVFGSDRCYYKGVKV